MAEISEAFDKMAQLGLLLGVRSIKDLPGAWVQKVDDHWSFAVNGHDEEVRVAPTPSDMAATVKRFEAAVWYRGWLAASLSPAGGVFLNASEDEFIDALDRAIALNAPEPPEIKPDPQMGFFAAST